MIGEFGGSTPLLLRRRLRKFGSGSVTICPVHQRYSHVHTFFSLDHVQFKCHPTALFTSPSQKTSRCLQVTLYQPVSLRLHLPHVKLFGFRDRWPASLRGDRLQATLDKTTDEGAFR